MVIGNEIFNRVSRFNIAFDKSRDIDFWDNRSVRNLVLLEDTLFDVGGRSIYFKGGREVSFHRNGVVESGYLLDGLFFRVGGRDIKFGSGCIVEFGEDGSFRGGVIKESVLVRVFGVGVLFGSGGIEFSGDEVVNGVLGRDEYLRVGSCSIKFESGSYVEFWGGGFVRSGLVKFDSVIGGVEVSGGSYVEFSERGEVI